MSQLIADMTMDNTMSVVGRSGLDTRKRSEAVLCISFNQDKSCVAIGTNFGYKIYNAKNYKKIGERDLDMPICKIQMLYRSNLLMLVRGAQDNMRIPDNKLIFWDDKANESTGMLELKHNINKIKMRKDLMYIIHEKSIQIFSLESLQVIKKLDTKLNPFAIFTCSYGDNRIIAYPSPDRKAGFFTMKNLQSDRDLIIDAHSHEVECLEMDYHGTVIASASKKGTIIRVFKIKDGSVLQEFRRGIDNAKIMSLCFDVSGTMLGLSSDSGTVHLFAINNEEADKDNRENGSTSDKSMDLNNKKSRFSFLSKAIKYFESEWSSLQLKVDEKIVFVNFNSDSSEVLVYKSSGKFWKYDLKDLDKPKSKKKVELTDYVRILQQA